MTEDREYGASRSSAALESSDSSSEDDIFEKNRPINNITNIENNRKNSNEPNEASVDTPSPKGSKDPNQNAINLASTEVKRKGKTLNEYPKSWLLGTKYKLEISSEDWRIGRNSTHIWCLKCNCSKPFAITEDSYGSWKTTTFTNHLKKYHNLDDKVQRRSARILYSREEQNFRQVTV